ncbi:conserved Plasmodium protein, unknown function [Plasmodium knowlesi strain H]|uniref:Uncharacterized protein n=3 Tax=Plasmodium knowlesi TaxID=5850 RepID=A0A5K1U402_PLAKH|nr:conserved Plasmodium protein, unknown function [Plasmodium knowlesi strain H]OTN65562.1 Uncharacterized protein PKNOH_S110116300 [Plasmodium knowlesi]CAA9989779.1 conserved Plasmodium protein, unknown function [Plasmodium knowlesi strain H]SBO22933.1 conserved Plasmodium protein, unknown function [Plasmodium knowlesi strain H]SBO22965.1 conserved Plasmodium protein, unknown function [Plasmodium knowlesi strain H]VVS79253.1 conserved Plasmodium protein, unknown function [Plasmodium knowlesi |eukprot:XP_002260502.1 hypothetical protein, conserved in Plasmodium species [Plasmodium knowlesi strain H]
MKKGFFSRVHYSNCVHHKFKRSKECYYSKGAGKLLKNLNYYSRKEKKEILKKIHENIILKKNNLKEKLTQFYINDKDVKDIFEKERISNEDDKLVIIKQVESNEEALINKFNNFYDLLHFSLQNLERQGGQFSNNRRTFKLNDMTNCVSSNVFEMHECVTTNLDLIKKFLVFIDKNLDAYERTSCWFKICFCLNKFVIYFFNYSFPFVEFFDSKLLFKYSYLFIKLSLLENSAFVSKQNEKRTENIYTVNISNEEIFDLVKNNNKNVIRLLLLLSERKSHVDLLDLSEVYLLYVKKTKIREWIENVNSYLVESVMGNRGGSRQMSTFVEEPSYESKEVLERSYEEMFCEKDNRTNYHGYFICLYFNLLYLVNKLVSNYVSFVPYMNDNILPLLDCIGLLCEGILEEDHLSERKIKNWTLLLSRREVEKYVIKDIIADAPLSRNIHLSEYGIGGRVAPVSGKVEEMHFPYDGLSYTKNGNMLVCEDDRRGTNGLTHDVEEDSLLRRSLLHEECFLKLHEKTKHILKLLFENMTHLFILSDCEGILKFLQTVYLTRYMNMWSTNILFYSIWLNAEFLEMYQVKNVLFFLSLFKSNFILKNMDLGNSIYSWYNKKLIFYLRKKIEIYFENNTLESSIKSVFILSDLLSHNKVIKKILLKKLLLLNFNNIQPSLFCQIFFLLNKLRFDASNTLFCELFLKHYKRVIHSLTCVETLDLIKNAEYLISRKKRKIFVVLILYFFKKLEQSAAVGCTSPPLLNVSYIFKLINIINKFKLFEFCRKDYFLPIYRFIFFAKEGGNGVGERAAWVSSDSSNFMDTSKCNHYSFLIKNNQTILLDVREMETREKGKDIPLLKEHNGCKDSYKDLPNEKDIKFEVSKLNEQRNLMCTKHLRVKLEVLTTSEILDLIFFSINIRKNIYLIGELHTELFYRILRSANFSKKQIVLCFRSIWMSRVFHLNFFEALTDMVTNNIKMVSNSIFALDILLCLCSYKHRNIYDSLVVSLFDMCLDDIDKILKNMKTQVLFYSCVIFLEVYYPLLFLKIIRRGKNLFRKNRKNSSEQRHGVGVDLNGNLPNVKPFKGNQKNGVPWRHVGDTLEEHTIQTNVKRNDAQSGLLIDIPSDAVNNIIRDPVGRGEGEGDLIMTMRKETDICLEDSGDSEHPADVLKHLKQVFLLQQKKHAYSYDLINFCETLHKLKITKIKVNNIPNVFFKNHEIDDLLVLNVFYPALKFCIIFTRGEKASKSLKKIIHASKICKTSEVHNVNKGAVDISLTEEKNLSEGTFNLHRTQRCNGESVNNADGVDKDNELSSRSHNCRENDVDILAQKLYLLKKHRINTMVIPIEKVDLFFKVNLVEEQNAIINESNMIFEKVYQQILASKRKDILADRNILASLMRKQLQYIFQLS